MKQFCIFVVLLFLVAPIFAATWTGATSINWDTASNWSPAGVPTSTTDVVIPNTSRKPQVIWANATCRDLTIQANAILYVNSTEGHSLTVNGIMTVNGTLNMSGTASLSVSNDINCYGTMSVTGSGGLTAYGDVFFFSGSSFVDSSQTQFQVHRDLKIYSGANFVMNHGGRTNLVGSQNTNIYNYSAATQFGYLIAAKTVSSADYYVNIHGNSTQPFKVNKDIINFNKNRLSCTPNITVTVLGNIIDQNAISASDLYGIKWQAGTIKMDGSSQQLSLPGPGCYLNHLICNATTGVITNNTLIIKGNLSINRCYLSVNGNKAIKLAGSWNNTVGTSGFVPGTGTVIFNQVGGTQTVTGANKFYNVLDSHTGGPLEFHGHTQILESLTVNANVSFRAGGSLGTVSNSTVGANLDFYNNFSYSISSYTGGPVYFQGGGNLSAHYSSHVNIIDFADDGLYGKFLADGGHFEFHQDAEQRFDLNGNMTILNDGIVDVYGGTGALGISYRDGCIFTLSSGSFNVMDRGIQIYPRAPCQFFISGGTITVNGNWQETLGIFKPTGGSVVMTGSGNNTIQTHADSWFWNLTVNKAVARENSDLQLTDGLSGNQTSPSRACDLGISATTIKGGLDILAVNDFHLSGDVNVTNAGAINVANANFELRNRNLISTGNVNINANAILQVGAGGALKMSNGRNINVNSGGTLKVIGNTSTAGTITRNVSGNYALNMNSGGTLNADYAVFEYMDSNGLNILPGATISALPNSTFQNGAAGGCLLKISNNQSITINNNSFPTNAGGSAKNVHKTNAEGNVTFRNAIGIFSGATFENDPHNRIFWDDSGAGGPQNLQITLHEGSPKISWDAVSGAATYDIYTSTDPYGPFTWYSSTSVPYKVDNSIVEHSKLFYRVTSSPAD